MNLCSAATLASLAAGGPGSGCHGDSCGRPAGSGKAETYHHKVGGVRFSDDVNAVPMVHTTAAANVASIQKEGFRWSSNSMYGQGVYFSNRSTGGGHLKEKAELNVTLAPHKQVYIEHDTDSMRIYKELVGVDQFQGARFREKMVEAGYGSARIKMDEGEVYTVVFDKGLIQLNKNVKAEGAPPKVR